MNVNANLHINIFLSYTNTSVFTNKYIKLMLDKRCCGIFRETMNALVSSL